jgi:hypothetical protein
MATRSARQVITGAFRRMGFISEDEALTAEQTSRALEILNDMMNGWEAEGIQYTHADLGLDDTVNVPDFLVRSTTWRLVPELAQEYGKVLTDAQNSDVTKALHALQAYYTPVPIAQLDEGIANRRTVTYGTITSAL